MKDSPREETYKSVLGKVTNYLFDLRHDQGGPKGRWFIKALGFDPTKPEHAKLLADQICFDEKLAMFTHDTEWGPRFEQDITVTGPNGKTIERITAIWQRDRGSEIIKLLTVIPPKSK
jgi:hypothetical protein